MKNTQISKGLLLAACTLGLALQLQAQSPPVASHYPIGVEGIRGASLPPPGVYLRDYNYFYYANRIPDAPAAFNDNFNVFVYVQAPRLIWMTDWKPLGLNYGMDVIVPFSYVDAKTPAGRNSTFGLSDIQIEPVLLSTSFKQLDLAGGYAVWAPTGDFDAGRLDSPGKGFWTHMFTLGGTYYFDEAKSWALSVLNRYEINHEQDETGITPGQTYSVEWGLSKGLTKTLEIGAIGYYQQQVTTDSGTGSSNERARVVGVGPEVAAVIPQLGLLTSVRYAYEFAANERPEGHTAVVTLTKKF